MLAFLASDCCLALILSLQKILSFERQIQDLNLAKSLPPYFPKSLKIELNHNFKKGPTMQKWMGSREDARFAGCIWSMNSKIAFDLKNVTEMQFLTLH